jgi:hypothetical protein
VTAADPCRKFLGVEASAGPKALLGLGAADPSAAAVEAALRDRIARTYAHPDGRRPEAEEVRARLREAARAVLAMARPPRPAPRRRAPAARRAHPVARLTDFDRHVLAVLVACGGWNASTRSRLVGLATAYGVSVGGLLKVVQGLSEYAKSGGARLSVAEITGGGGRLEVLPGRRPAPAEPDLQWLAKVAPELMESSARSTFKLSLLFGSFTLLIALVAVRLLLVPSAPPPAPPAEPPPSANAAIERATPPVAPPRPPEPAAPTQRMLMLVEEPTFTGRALTAETVAAADGSPQLVAVIDDAARRITINDDPSETVFRNWSDAIDTIATGWVLVGDSVRESLDQAIFDALYAASDSPSVSDRLLEALTPPPWRILEPADVWRGAWMAGTLARISQSTSLSPAVVDRARAQLEVALGGPLPEGETTFEDAAGAWLDRAAGLLVDAAELDPNAYDLWEFWIAAQRRLGRGDRFDAAVLDVIETILASSADLGRPSRTVNVLGRLLTLLDFETSRLVKDRIGGLFADEQRFPSRDLWVLTSLLARYDAARWFGKDLVLPMDADWMYRRRIADRIDQQWPAAATAVAVAELRLRGVPIDPDLAARWLAVFGRQQERPIEGSPEALLDALIAACRLNEAASWLSAGDADRAAPIIAALEGAGATGAMAGAPPPAARRTGEPIGADGEWAVRYDQAGRGGEERLKWLEALRLNAGTDLGPIDAEVFVRVAYRGTPPEIRTLAQTILVEQFGTGPVVARELLDQLPGVPSGRAVSEMIGRLTGRLLPSPHSDAWPIDARLALVEHALSLQTAASSGLDAQVEAVVASYANRRSALDPDWSRATSPLTPRSAAEGLARAWRRRATDALGDAAAGGSAARALADLQRRHAARLRLVAGPIQGFVAAQVAVLDQMAFAAVAEQRAWETAAAEILTESARRRSRSARVLEQAVEAERAIGRLWRMQIQTTEADRS